MIWSGRGYGVAVIAVGCSLVCEVTVEALTGDADFYQDQSWPLSLALLLAAGLCFIWSRRMPGHRNTFFFLPARYWTGILLGAAVIRQFV